MNKEPTIMDIKSNKLYIHLIFHFVFITLLLNIIFGSYLNYVAKVLHIIKLPMCLNEAPYTEVASAPAPPANSFVNINYLWSISQEQIAANKVIDDARIERIKMLALGKDISDELKNKSTEQIPFKIDRELYYNKIKVEGADIPFETDICSYLYKENSVLMVTFYLLVQHFYSFNYWGICMFFSSIYGGNLDDKAENNKSSWKPFIWEFFMIIVSPIYFMFF